MPVGKRIYLKRDMPEPEIIKEFKSIPASNVSDVMERLSAMNPRIRLMSNPKNHIMAGPALTIKTSAGDNLLIHAALNIAQKGDILVISNGGGSNRALLGEIMITYLMEIKKVSGIVLDGPVRDINKIARLDFPIYATGATPGGPYKNGPGEINVPIACGDISVNPGDIILADPDGVIVIPLKESVSILKDAKKFQKQDVSKLLETKKGIVKRDWVEKALIEKGYEIVNDAYDK